jgi:hypothetical protein
VAFPSKGGNAVPGSIKGGEFLEVGQQHTVSAKGLSLRLYRPDFMNPLWFMDPLNGSLFVEELCLSGHVVQ